MPTGGSDVSGSGDEVSDEVDEKKLEEAKVAYVNGEAPKAIELARSAGKSSKSWRIIGAAACNMKDLKLAQEAYKHLDSAGRQYMYYSCQRHQVVIFGNGQFKLAD